MGNNFTADFCTDMLTPAAWIRVLAAYNKRVDRHEAAGGDLCTDDGSGMCSICHVGLDDCPLCSGKGYHREDCEEAGC